MSRLIIPERNIILPRKKCEIVSHAAVGGGSALPSAEWDVANQGGGIAVDNSILMAYRPSAGGFSSIYGSRALTGGKLWTEYYIGLAGTFHRVGWGRSGTFQNTWVMYANNGSVIIEGSAATSIATFPDGSIVNCGVDLTGTFPVYTFYKTGVLVGTYTSTTPTVSYSYYAATGMQTAGGYTIARKLASMTYPPPSGFTSYFG